MYEELKQCHLEYRTNIDIQNIMSNIKRFGEVQIVSKRCDIVLSRKKTKEAQIMVQSFQSRSIENVKLEMNKTIATQGTYIFGCCMIPAGKIAFTYYYDCAVRVFSNTGFKNFEVRMPNRPQDILYINTTDSLAVTLSSAMQPCVTIINVDRKQITNTITLDSCVYGIALRANKLIYSGRDKGIGMINLSDGSLTQMFQDEIPSDCYIATYQNKIYHTNSGTNDVICYDQHGKLEWTFQNENLLKDPRGIDVDSDGNVYVAGGYSNNVVVISPDGKRHREVLAGSDGLNIPFSLCFDNSKKQLLVANCNNEARLYDFI